MLLLAALCLCVGRASSQVSVAPAARLASNVIVPQSRAFAVRPDTGCVQVSELNVGVVIIDQVSTTTMDVELKNPTRRRLEAELIVPVPDGALVRGFTFQGAGSEPTARILPKEEARRTYDAIVAKTRDPALLEFVGYNLIRSSVFPVPAGGTQKVRLTYEHLLAADGGRIDYVLPRSESIEQIVPCRISVKIRSKRPISTAYSPTHKIEMTRGAENVVSVRVADDAVSEPGPFRLSYLSEQDGVSATLFAYPDAKTKGGYFLLLAGLPAALPKGTGEPAIKREVTLVLDRSGSMHGEKIQQAREAAFQVLAGLEKGEAFNIIAYSHTVDLFAERPVIKSERTIEAARAYLKSIRATGGTNIHDALFEALRQPQTEDMLPIVLFLTDGLPTVGETSELAIRSVATDANPQKRRIFTFGVGVDVNAPLLDKIAADTRATSTYVLPKEDVEVKVGGLFKRLAGPVLAEPVLRVVDGDGKAALGRTHDVIPARLPDLFEGDQLVLLGQYVGEAPLGFEVSGNYLGNARTFKFSFGLDNSTTRNAFVPRLWASRRIGVLIDAIRQAGAEGEDLPTAGAAAANPKMKELVDEIVRLSIEFGILTEYTAFLAQEGTDLARRDAVLWEAISNVQSRAVESRVGLSAVNQSYNYKFQSAQRALNLRNTFYDQNMNRVSIATVQQVNDRAFYQRGNRWVDSRIVERESTVKPARVIEFGSEEFRRLALRLADEGRQGSIALRGEILIVIDDEPVLVKNDVE